MVTMGLQVAVTLAFLVFGLTALAIAKRTWGESRNPASAWWLTGAAFTLHALSIGIQNGFGILALSRGPGSATWDDYMFWNPIFNHSRTFHLLAFAVTLAWLLLRPSLPQRRFLVASVAIILAGMMGGAFMGWKEEVFSELSHYSAVARWDVIELLVLLAVLFGAMVTEKFDRLLWFALCIYAFRLALNILWFAALSRMLVPGEWAPRPWTIHAFRLVLTIGIALVAVYRLVLARRGVHVPGLLGRATRRAVTIG